MKQINSADPFSRKEQCVGWVFSATIALTVGYFSLLWQHSAEQNDVIAEAEFHKEQIYNSITKISGLTTSIRTLYRITMDFGNDELEQFTDDLVGASDSITSIGRFDHIERSEIESFSALMSERGIYRFQIKNLNPDGSVSPAPPRRYHNSIASVSPFSPQAARLIGVDLSYDQTLTKSISDSISTNDAVLTAYPKGWPKSADALLFIPTYAGKYIPETIPSRHAQNDGGYYIELSFTRFIPASERLNSEINIPGSTITDAQITNERRFFKDLFSGHLTEMRPLIGSSEITISINSADGVSMRNIEYALLWILLALAFLAIAYQLAIDSRRKDLYRLSAQKSLEAERRIALTTLEAINDSVLTLTSEGNISYINPAGESMLQLNADELLGVNFQSAMSAVHGGSGKRSLMEIEKQLTTGESAVSTEFELQSDKSITHVDCAFTPFGDTPNGGVLVMRDVGKERALRRKLEHLATHDSLTGLMNRYYFEMQLEELVLGATHKGESHAVCYIDLDQFKTINDTCGHQSGDQLLVQIANHLKNNCRNADLLARLGGDEFGLLIRNSSEKECELIARRLHDTLQSFYFTFGEQKFAVRACFGFVAINREFDQVSDYLAAADIACYSAKDKGRNELHVFKSECEETTQRQGEMHMLPKIQNALSFDRFVLFVQPIAEIQADGVDATKKYEILLRMKDDNGSLITPFQLISAAERYDLMKGIDRWVINKAFHDIAELQKIYGEAMPTFSINLSGQSVMDSELIGYIIGKVAQTSVPTDKICFEITETSAMGNLTQALTLLEFLHNLGCTVALDDFGAGECSFAYLKSLPVDYLKVDGQFVKDVDTCEVHKEMLIFVQRVAKLLEMKTVAEFVENEAIVTCLRDLGINYAQGYHISKPYSLDELKSSGDMKKAA